MYAKIFKKIDKYAMDICKHLTEGILGLGGCVCLEGLGLALGVDGPDPELVVLALGKPWDLGLGALGNKNTTKCYKQLNTNLII